MGIEKGVVNVEEEDVAYWPMGGALSIFTGAMQTHGSMNLVGKILSGVETFRKVRSGTPIKIERATVPG